MRGSMKFYPRSGVWKSVNVVYDPTTRQATSYGWWIVVKEFKLAGSETKCLVFNSYPYSISTQRHQRKLRHLLKSLGEQVAFEIDAPQGLQALTAAKNYYENKILRLQCEIERPRSHAGKNIERRAEIGRLGRIIDVILQLRPIDERAA